MRRLLAIVLAGLLGFAAPAFAQNAAPVLIGQNAAPVGGQGGTDALAQAQDGTAGLSPLLVGGLVVLGAAGLVAIISSQSKSDTPVSP